MRTKNDNLQTPEYITDVLGPFDIDVCAAEHSTIGEVNLWDGRGEDGLALEWNGFAWCNPPFSQKELWADKMHKHGNGLLILPERGSAPWFGPLASKVGQYFIMGKNINFIGGPSSNNLGSVIFPFGEEAVSRIEKSGLPGMLVLVKSFVPRSTTRSKS